MKQIKPEGKRQNFHVIPHFLIYNPEFGEKRILFQMALANNMMLKWNPEKPPILYNTNLLVRQMSFSQNYNSSGINEQVKKFMKLIEDKGYVKKVASSSLHYIMFRMKTLKKIYSYKRNITV